MDLPPRPRERFTLVGCTPSGAIDDVLKRLPAEALGTDQAWLGDVHIAAPPPPPGTAPSWWGEDLGDVVVLAQRPNTTVPGTLDIDLDGFVYVYDRSAVAREHLVPGYDQRRLGPAITLADLVDMLTAHHIDLDLR